MDLAKFRKDIIAGKKDVDAFSENEMVTLQDLVNKYTHLECLTNEQMDECKDLIMILLDFYTYNSNGDVLVSDYAYDQLMRNYLLNGGESICHADNIYDTSRTRWEFVTHEVPGIVGSVKKVYEEMDLYRWYDQIPDRKSIKSFRIAPKFDGVSSAIKISGDGRLLQAVTRNDGYKGQDITMAIACAKNIQDIIDRYASMVKSDEYIWIKTEIVMRSSSFNKCIKEKPYANRRSACSGIISSPKNVYLAKYLEIIPLAVYNIFEDKLIYEPLNSYIVETKKPYELMNEIEKMLSIIRDADYHYRTDGVVIYPLEFLSNFNQTDIMDDAIAFKVNTNEAFTTVDYGYVSIGPLGYARPMLHVHPVEVNETIVQDVSLGSFDVFASMDLHEGEQIYVFSAGDVIPQAKLPQDRYYDKKAKLIKIKKKCPFCNKKLERSKSTYRCVNPDCPRVNQGKIINFITKLHAKNIADKTIEDLYTNGLIKTIPDIFDLQVEDIKSIDGYKDAKANIIIDEFKTIQSRETTISELLGALGIQGISTKKCRNIIKTLGSNYKQIFKKHPEKLFFELTTGNGIGEKTASIFIDFIKENRKLINTLIDTMHIVADKSYYANIVFTGFRDPDLEATFNSLGIEISSNVNNDTYCVINGSYTNDSTKCMVAAKKNIPIFHRVEASAIIDQIKERIKN